MKCCQSQHSIRCTTRLGLLMNRFILSILFPFFLVQSQDRIVQKSYHFEIDHDDGYFEILSENQTSITIKTEKFSEYPLIVLGSPSYAPLSDFECEIDGKSISDDWFWYENRDYRDVFFSDFRYFILNIRNELKPGTEIIYRYVREYQSEAFLFPIVIPNLDHFKDFEIVFEHDEDYRIEFHPVFIYDNVIYNITRKTDETTFHIPLIDKFEELDYFPFNDMLGKIYIQIFYKGRSIIPDTPNGIANWYASHTDIEPMIDPEKIPIEIIEICRGKEKEQIIEILYDYVRENIRYEEDAREDHLFIPQNPETILYNRFGDCKDKSNLLAALAANWGIKLSLALISAKNVFVGNKLYISDFDHVICFWQNDRLGMFIDPTARFHSFGSIPDQLINKDALILDEKNAKLVKVEKAFKSSDLKVTFMLDPINLDSVRTNLIIRNDLMANLKNLFHEKKGIDRQNALSQFLSAFFYKISLYSFENISISADSLVLKALADFKRLLISTEKNIYIPQAIFFLPIKSLKERKEDDLPVYMRNRLKWESRLILTDSSYKFIGEPINHSENDKFGIITSLNNNTGMVYSLEYYNTNLKFSGFQKKEFLQFIDDIYKFKNKLLTLKRRSR